MAENIVRATFGEMEAAFAEMHDIASEKRTSFQARLKHFNRIGLPFGMTMEKGKTSYYRAGEIMEMALPVEFTQLGLPPDRMLSAVKLNTFPIWMAIGMAAREIKQRPEGFDLKAMDEPDHDEMQDPMSMFLWFDPTALAPLMTGAGRDEDQASATLFYGGYGVVRENIVRWTLGYGHRLALINVTAMLDRLTSSPIGRTHGKSDAEWRMAFMADLEQATSYRLDFPSEDTDDDTIVRWARDHLSKLFYQDSIDDLVNEIVRRTGISPIQAYNAVRHELNTGAAPFREGNNGDD